MASWTDQDPSTLLPGKAWTSAKAIAAFENPEALAEGADGAPRNRGKSLDTYLYEGSITATSTDITDLNEISIRIDHATLNASSIISGNLRIAFSNDNGSTFGSLQNVSTFGINFAGSGWAFINLSSGKYRAGLSTGATTSGTLTVPSGVNAIRINATTGITVSMVINGVGAFG